MNSRQDVIQSLAMRLKSSSSIAMNSPTIGLASAGVVEALPFPFVSLADGGALVVELLATGTGAMTGTAGMTGAGVAGAGALTGAAAAAGICVRLFPVRLFAERSGGLLWLLGAALKLMLGTLKSKLEATGTAGAKLVEGVDAWAARPKVNGAGVRA